MLDQDMLCAAGPDGSRVEATVPAPSALDPDLIEAIGHHNAGRMAEAELLYQKILASSPENALANYGFALLRTTQCRLVEAAEAYRQAIAAKPDFVEAYINLGTVVLGLGQPEEAVALYRNAITISPDNGMAYGNLGKALQDLGRINEAMDVYRLGLFKAPDNISLLVNCSAALLELQAWDDAITITRRAIILQPNNPIAHANLGTALLRSERYQEALAACRQALSLPLQGVAIHSTLGGAMLELGALQEAVTLCRQAISLDASLPDAHFNLSHALRGLNHLDEARLSAQNAIDLRPDCAAYHFQIAQVMLLQGDLEAGWREYEWRLQQADFAWVKTLFEGHVHPTWRGEDIAGKTILVFTEQGLGDIIQFVRYLPLLVSRAGQVIVATFPATRQLLEMIDGITVVPMREAPLQHFDVQCPLLSLPLAFATRLSNVPANVPYFHVEPREQARWNRRIGGAAMRVGIVWAGNPITHRDRFRSPGFSSVAPLFSVSGIDFVILQVGAGRKGLQPDTLPSHVLDLGQEVADLADTAAIMAGLDLMISSCTGPLHLAGALGVPTWAMIPFSPHFPWLLERSDSPWYPTIRLYRQEQPGQAWSGVVARIEADLAALSKAHDRRRLSISSGCRQSEMEAGSIVQS